MKKQTGRRINGVLLLAVLIVSALVCGEAYGKYVKQEQFSGSVTVTAQLGSITVQESPAVRLPDGSYQLNTTADKVKANIYKILPGLDIPKDPSVTVTRKSTVPVYVFLEVVQTAGQGVVTFTVDPVWEPLSVTGANGGTVYVYAPGGTVAKVTKTINSINVLAEQTVTVSQKATGDMEIIFHAGMRQVIDGLTPADIYSSTDY